MNLPTAVGAPITRTLQGVTHHFPRLNLREYGALLQSWIDKDLVRLTAELAERHATDEETASSIREFKRTTRTQGYIARKLADWRHGPAIVDLSLAKAGQNLTADQLAIDLDDLAELCLELWSRNFLQIYRESRAAMQQASNRDQPTSLCLLPPHLPIHN